MTEMKVWCVFKSNDPHYQETELYRICLTEEKANEVEAGLDYWHFKEEWDVVV